MAINQGSMDRQQFDRGNTEPDEIVDHRWRGQAGECAAVFGIDAGIEFGDPADVEFENYGLFPRYVWPTFLAPGKGGFDNPAFWDVPRIVAPIDRQILAWAAETITESGVRQPQAAVQ